MSQILAKGLSKVFGSDPERGLELREQGATKQEILEDTGLVLAVDDATFDVRESEIFVLMGLSGSGKSTLARLLNRLIEPTAGTVEIQGRDVMELSDSELRDLRSHMVTMVFQHFALFPHYTVRENVAYGLRVRDEDREERRQRADETLELVGLGGWGDSRPNELSGGMQQRVGLARALATDAPILLMDEPFSALDPLIRRDMQDELIRLQRQLDRTVVFITHDLNEAMRIGDRIAIMNEGRIVQVGTGPEIIRDPADEYVANFVADVDRSRVLSAESIMRKPRVTLTRDTRPQRALDILDDLEVNGLYVLDADERILGVARDVELAAARREQRDTLADDLIDDYATVDPDTPLAELSELAAQHTVPVAVTDDGGRLLGVITRARLLNAFAGQED